MLPFSRPFGTLAISNSRPQRWIETLGYCLDVPPGQDEQVCSRDTTIAGQKPLENPRNPLLSRPPLEKSPLARGAIRCYRKAPLCRVGLIGWVRICRDPIN